MCLKSYTGICPHCGQVFPFIEEDSEDGIWTTDGEDSPSDAIVKCIYCNTTFNPFHEQCRKEHAQRRQRAKDNRPQEIKIETIITLPGGKRHLLNKEFIGSISNNDDLRRYLQDTVKPYNMQPIGDLSNNIGKEIDKIKADRAKNISLYRFLSTPYFRVIYWLVILSTGTYTIYKLIKLLFS